MKEEYESFDAWFDEFDKWFENFALFDNRNSQRKQIEQKPKKQTTQDSSSDLNRVLNSDPLPSSAWDATNLASPLWIGCFG